MLLAYGLTDRGLKQVAVGDGDPLAGDVGWLDLYRPTEAERRVASVFIGTEIPTREETQEIEFSSRYYTEDGTVFMTISALAGVDLGKPTLTPFTFVIGATRVVTIRYEDTHAFRQFLSRAQRPSGGCSDGPNLFASLLEAFIERVADVLERMTMEADRINQEIFAPAQEGRRRGWQLRQLIYDIGKQGDVAAKARESLASLERLIQFANVSLTGSYAKGAMKSRLKLIGRDVRSIEEHTAYLDNKITFLLDATLGLISTEQNDVIRLLTVAATIFFPPTLIGTIYGMNFHVMPELDWLYGYPVALAAMGLSALLPYLYFRRRGWL